MDAGAVDGLANSVDVWLLVKLNVDQRAAAEIDAQLDAVPEKHRQNARYAEDQRKGEEVPLLPQPIDIYATKQFHLKYSRLTWYATTTPIESSLSALLALEDRIEDVRARQKPQ